MTPLRAKWTIRVDRLETRLAAEARKPQPVSVSLVINGLARAVPAETTDCLDHRPVCEWITREWPKSPPTPLLQTRINELLTFVFGFDKRVQDAWVGIYWPGTEGGAGSVGVERQVSRSQFEAQRRLRRSAPAESSGERLPRFGRA